ncbi:MAG TPA: HEAT repeat domain-containing protein [Polyangia bacterium]|jgi:HEAT repeat protein|nr:HEAT repeat domain-containing protein [Polyangia bacterium]
MSLVAGRIAFSPEDLRRVEEIERLAKGGGVDRLIGMLDDPNWAVRRAVVAALAASGPGAVGLLCEALQDRRDNEGRIAATVDALAAFTGDADPALAAMAAADVEIPVLADIAQILGRRRTTSALSTVIALSRHADDNVAAAAIEALGRIGGRAAVDSLVDAVKSANFFRAFPAIEVLGRSGDPRAVAPLTALLDQPQYAAEAARALGRTGDVAAVAPLVRLISKSASAIVRLCAVSLADLRQRYQERAGNGDVVAAEIAAGARDAGIVRPLILALTQGEPGEQVAICVLLGVAHDPSAAPALTALLDAAPPVADAASAALRGLGPQVEEQILQGIRDGDSTHKRALLPFISSASATLDVVDCLNDPDADVRVLACEALARMGAVPAVGALFRVLADADPRVSYAAVAAIQSLGSHEADRLAVEAARSSDVRIRRAALRILSYFGSSLALDVFIEALRDPDERVRESAVQGLPFMDDPRAFDALLAAAKDASDKTRAAAMRSLGQCVGDLRASAYLLKGLGDPDAWVRYYACQALGKLASEPAAEAIIRLLADPAGQVRVAAVEALSCLRGDAAAQALNAAAVDADSDIQRAALVGLGVAQRSDALPLILNAARSPDAATRLVAISALAGFRSLSVLSAFRVAAADPDESVRTASIGFLAAMTGGPATRTLISLLATGTVTEQVLAALSLHVEGRIAGLVVGLEEADDETAPALTSALARMRRPDASAALVQAMSMRNVAARKAAASALAVLGSKEALAALRTAASADPQPEVRQICSLLLSR